MPVHGITAKYRPFSFNDYMAPVLMYQERYDKMQDALASKYDEIGAWKGIVDPNSTAGKTLTQYEQTLQQAAQDLATDGLKAVSRNTLFDLKRTYNSQIAPIKTAATNYLSIQDDIRKAKAKDDTLMVSDVPTIEDLMANPSAYPTFQSGAALMKDGVTAALTLPGVTYEQLSRYMNGDATAIPDLDKTVASIAQNKGVTSGEGIAYIKRGILAGMGEKAAKEEALKRQHDLAMERERYEQGQQNYRAGLSLANSRESRDLTAALNGRKPEIVDGKRTGRYIVDEEAIKQMTEAGIKTAKDSKGKVKQTKVYTTKGTKVYNKDGYVSGNPTTTNDKRPINDISKESTETKVIALKHAKVPIEDYKAVGSKGYVKEEIDRLVEENKDLLNAYNFYEDTKGNIWCEETAPKDLLGSSAEMSAGQTSLPQYPANADNEVAEEDL